MMESPPPLEKQRPLRAELPPTVCQAEAEENHQKAVKTIDQLETEKSDLKDKAKMLRNMVQDIQNLLSMAKWEYDDRKRACEQEQKAYSILQAENKEMKKTLILQEELLKVCQAEAEENHKEAMGTIDQLEAEKSKLTYKAKMMRDIVQDMGNLLSMTNRECYNQTSECEREREVYSILQAENEEMKKALIHQEELMKVCQAEAEENHRKAVETIDQLGAEKSDLTDKVKRLRDIVQDMGNLLSVTKRECDDRTSECEREWEAYSILQAENKEMKKALIHQEELIKVCQAEAEENHKKAVETIDQLEAEKSDLTDKVKTLRDIVQDMGNLLSTTNREFDDLTSECEREREAYSILQAENEEMKKTLIHQEELMKFQVCQAEAEENHKKAMETIDQLEAEKSKLISEAKMLRDIVQDMENLLSMTNRECDDRRNECEREAHRVLQAKCNEMKKKRGGVLKI
ncbi:tropomyosin-like [Neoarius graeffei]|uniref:tropomyosin-like n=1 Tax=Neoarius graeffei TaxID=443677 RepID=UPI00298C86D9|nr:tropomyosin-like [Neoarius graeffei]